MSSPKARILVVDDEPDLRTLYELTLLRAGYEVETAGNVLEAQQRLQNKRYDILITDMRLPDGLGMELLTTLQKNKRSERCIVITAYGSAENAVEALKTGAFDYLTKPVDLKLFRSVVASALQDTQTPAEPVAQSAVAATPPSQAPQFGTTPATEEWDDITDAGRAALERMVGTSAVMKCVKQRIIKVARGMAPILVRGESGSGKELVAQAIHANSQRANGPLIAVNCGAIPENLLESEFFGAKKGSYTGSTVDRDGYFQAARGGTLFLDEIGDLPLAMQAKLLRAIQERSVRAIGSTQEEVVDVRIVSATHKDLAADVAAGRFRQDLYYRLNVIEIIIPPLRERRDDLPALCHALLAKIGQESGLPIPALSEQTLNQLVQHPLSGNVRELENLLHRAVALSDGNSLQIDLAPSSFQYAETPPLSSETLNTPAEANNQPNYPENTGLAPIPNDLQSHLDQQEREILIRALEECNYNRTATAHRLNISLRQIRYRIERLKITMPQQDEVDNEP